MFEIARTFAGGGDAAIEFQRESVVVVGMVKMGSNEEQDRKIVLEFCHLLEKSKQLFNGLR